MKYPKALMTIKELKELGWKDKYLRSIYRNRTINRNFSIAWKQGGEEKPHSTIVFDTEVLEKYRKSLCTGT